MHHTSRIFGLPKLTHWIISADDEQLFAWNYWLRARVHDPSFTFLRTAARRAAAKTDEPNTFSSRIIRQNKDFPADFFFSLPVSQRDKESLNNKRSRPHRCNAKQRK